MILAFSVSASTCLASEKAKEIQDRMADIKAEVEKAKPAVDPVSKDKPKEKQLQPVGDNTAAMLQQWLAGPQEIPSGFACPKCGKEMLRNVRILLATSPVMSVLRCPDEKCKFQTAIF